MSEYLTTQEAAARLSMNPATLKRYARAGLVPCVRLNARVLRFRADALDEWLRKREK